MSIKVKALCVAIASAAWACAPAQTPNEGAPQSGTAETAPLEVAPEMRLTALGVSVSCNATTLSRCDSAGCSHEATGQPSVPLSFNFDGATGEGDLCIATGCAVVSVLAPPGTPAGEGEDLTGLLLTAPVVFDEAADVMEAGPPEMFDGVVSIARDGSAFRIAQQSAGAVMVWGGPCAAQGQPG